MCSVLHSQWETATLLVELWLIFSHSVLMKSRELTTGGDNAQWILPPRSPAPSITDWIKNLPGFPVLSFPQALLYIKKFMCPRPTRGIQKLNHFAKAAMKTNHLCCSWAIRLPSQTPAEPAQLYSRKAIWGKIFMATAELFLPKQHLHFAGDIFRGGFPYCV